MTIQDGNFSHPYKPYSIQLQLMNQIYETIDKGYKVGLFESPTGTGKTLSLICSTMTWLRSNKNKRDVGRKDGNDVFDSEDDSEPEWVNEVYNKGLVLRKQAGLKQYEEHLDQMADEYERKLVRVHKLAEKRTKLTGVAEDDFVPDDYTSDTETLIKDRNELLKQEVNKLLLQVNGAEFPTVDVDDLDQNSTKLYSLPELIPN